MVFNAWISHLQFHWRFSKEDMHNRQMKKSTKAKLSMREKQTAEEKQEFEVTENTRNLEAQISTAAKPDPEQQPDDVIDLGQAVAGTKDGDAHHDGGLEETRPASCDTDDSAVPVCVSQSTSDCGAGPVTEAGDSAPVSHGCAGSGGAGLDTGCSSE